MTARPPAAAVAAPGSLAANGNLLAAWLGLGGGGAPGAENLLWSAWALSRRELGGGRATALPVALTTTGEPAGAKSPQAGLKAAAAGQWQPGSILGIFFGPGTAEHPNGGILIGNGFSWSATTCPAGTVCNGGNGGLIGNGGSGFNGGNGGSARWFGKGGDGGAGVITLNGGKGGNGGRGHRRK